MLINGIIVASSFLSGLMAMDPVFTNFYQIQPHGLDSFGLSQPVNPRIIMTKTDGNVQDPSTCKTSKVLARLTSEYEGYQSSHNNLRVRIQGYGALAIVKHDTGIVHLAKISAEESAEYKGYTFDFTVHHRDFVIGVVHDADAKFDYEDLARFFENARTKTLTKQVSDFAHVYQGKDVSTIVAQVSMDKKMLIQSFKTVSFPQGSEIAVISETANFRSINYHVDKPRRRSNARRYRRSTLTPTYRSYGSQYVYDDYEVVIENDGQASASQTESQANQERSRLQPPVRSVRKATLNQGRTRQRVVPYEVIHVPQ